MALTEVKKLEKNQVEISFDIDKKTFDDACQDAFKKNSKKFNVPGFRRGKATRGMIEKMYGKGVFYEDALEELVPKAYEDAIKEADLKPVSRPEYSVESIDDDGVKVKVTLYNYPEVEVGEYKGLKVERDERKITKKDVDSEIESVRKRNARQIDVEDRAAQMDDTVKIDYEGSVDGVPFEGGKAEGHSLKLGSGQFIPGFEDQIVGHNIGDEFDVNVKFPDDYHAEDLKGKEAVFKTKLHGITYEELPEEDDEFAKDVSSFDTLKEYREDIENHLKEHAKKDADANIDMQLSEQLSKLVTGDIPESMYEAETENILRDYDTRLRMQGLDLNTYLKYTGQDLDSMRGMFKEQAENNVKVRLALKKISEIENITVSKEDIDAEYDRIAKMYGMETDKVKEIVNDDSISEDLAMQKAMDFVKEKADVTEKTEKKKAPAKEKADDAEGAEKKKATKTTASKTTAAKTAKTADAKPKTAKKTADTAEKKETKPKTTRTKKTEDK